MVVSSQEMKKESSSSFSSDSAYYPYSMGDLQY